MLGSKFGLFIYLTFRNDLVWKSLSDKEKSIVLENNASHNVIRPDYVDPTLYQGGKSFDSGWIEPKNTREKLFEQFLITNGPRSVLEIGPGSGYLTRLIVEHPSVDFYSAIDINRAFLDYLEPRLSRMKSTKPDFAFTLFEGDANNIDLSSTKFDAVFLLSAVHHIPDRIALFRKLESRLNPGGKIFIGEPAHYIPRILFLWGKFWRTYRHIDYWSNPRNYGTHHFCTLEEFRKVVASTEHLRIVSCYYHRINFPKLVRKVMSKGLVLLGKRPVSNGTFETSRCNSLLRFFADRIVIELEHNR